VTNLSLEELEEKVKECTKCELYESRTNAVFGEGDPNTDLLLIGEGPGRVEDEQGRPFVGQAGKKLDEILNSVGIAREDVYITNVVKCRPPDNRTPLSQEMASCFPYLEAQIAGINPKLIVTLGNAATKMLLNTDQGITSLRGEFKPWRGNIKIFPMFHPSYLLRYQSKEVGSPKYLTWKDIQKVENYLKSL
jgi:DNA polymerase